MAAADRGLMDTMRSRGRLKEDEEMEECFHFIAYIYRAGHLWELDGLKESPIRLDACTKENWHTFAAPQIQERMERRVSRWIHTCD